uniref:Orphan G-protein coupled receptor 6 n=1 Tax=Platynereis dumerilii TaxID=6359 RepID=A0A0K0PUF0_PLADU|nr:orphan G-protein coupled receptor 6 [Platynereis dumerilii]
MAPNASFVTEQDEEVQSPAGNPPPKRQYKELAIAKGVDQYGGAFLLILGVFGNITSLIVLRRKRFRSLPSSLYLTVLAISDFLTIAVGQGGRHWIRALTGKDILSLSTFYCKVWYLIVPVSTSYSTWILTAVTVERCLAISAPLLAKKINMQKSSRRFLVISLVLLSLYYIYSLVLYEIVDTSRGKICDIVPKNEVFVYSIRPWFEYIAYSIFPGTLIFLCNVIMIITLIKARRVRRRQLANNKQQENETTGSIITMLLTISFTFLVLTTPIRVNFILNVYFPSNYWQEDSRAALNRLNWALSIFCLYLNHAINFLLYLISGREFRQEFASLFGCCPKQNTDMTGARTKTTSLSASKTATVSAVPVADNKV